MFTNKWVLLALTLVTGLAGSVAGFDWTSVVSASTAGAITSGLAVVLMILHAITPTTAPVSAPVVATTASK